MRNAPTLLILADDLTGSLDAGVQFSQRGVSSLVFIDPEFGAFPTEVQVVVVNTESRHLSSGSAGERVRAVTQRGITAGVPFFYKKTDSTLRGNIAVELKALREILGQSWMPFVPAFPRQGRTTREGIHYVHGKPIAETGFAHDPLNPIQESYVPSLLDHGGITSVSSMKIGEAISSGPEGIVVFDCETDEEMGRIGEQLGQTKLRAFSGSADFVQHLLPFLPLVQAEAFAEKPKLPILLVNGSLNATSLEQIAKAGDSFQKLTLSPQQLVSPEQTIALTHEKTNLLLHTITNRSQLEGYRIRMGGVGDDPGFHLMVARHLARHVRQLLLSNRFCTLVVFGGDTLSAIAGEMNWAGLIPSAEVTPGITVSRAPQGDAISIITKAGGFGTPDIINRILDFCRG